MGGLFDLVYVIMLGLLGWVVLCVVCVEGLVMSVDFCINFYVYCGYYGLGWLEFVVFGYLKCLYGMVDFNFVFMVELVC